MANNTNNTRNANNTKLMTNEWCKPHRQVRAARAGVISKLANLRISKWRWKNEIM